MVQKNRLHLYNWPSYVPLKCRFRACGPCLRCHNSVSYYPIADVLMSIYSTEVLCGYIKVEIRRLYGLFATVRQNAKHNFFLLKSPEDKNNFLNIYPLNI